MFLDDLEKVMRDLRMACYHHSISPKDIEIKLPKRLFETLNLQLCLRNNRFVSLQNNPQHHCTKIIAFDISIKPKEEPIEDEPKQGGVCE